MRLFAACLAAVAGLFAVDAVLFRSNLYPSILEPDSSTGTFEYILWRELQAQNKNGDNMVVTLGNSRFAYSPRLANEHTAESGYVFRSAGVAGSDPRSWYYMLRDLDPQAGRYRAIVFGVDDFDDEDTAFHDADDIRALHYVVIRLRLSDVIGFARSFDSPALQWEAFRGGLLKGFVLQRDVRAFLQGPRKRIEYVKLNRRGYEEWTYNYVEDPRTMEGLSVDWANWTVALPPDPDQSQRDTVTHTLMRRPVPQTGRLAGFRRLWFGRIIERYQQSRTRIIFVRLPRGPIFRPENLVEKKSASIREFASRPNVALANERAFESLEEPKLFKDAVHLNREGVARFSTMLVREVSRLLAQEQAGKR